MVSDFKAIHTVKYTGIPNNFKYLPYRNLCDRNEENQAVIASVDKKGVTVSELADDFALKLNYRH